MACTGALLAYRRPLMVVALVCLSVFAYFPVLSAGFVWDDNAHVVADTALASLGGLRKIWFDLGATQQYYPVVYTSFWIEQHLWGSWAGGYHGVNVVLHIANALLIGVLLQRLAVPGAWLAAALFALHPVHVESVAWISERKNVLSTFFYLLTLLSLLRFRETRAGTRRSAFYAAALLLFVLAMSSKTVVASLPAAMLLLIWWKQGRITRDDTIPLLPFFAIGLALGLVTIFVEKSEVGAFGTDWQLSPIQRLLIAGRAPWFYAGKLLWPSDLTFIYPRWEIDASNPLLFLYPLATAACLLLAWTLRSRIGRGPLVALLFFGGTLFPALGFFDVYPFLFSFVADHFQYLASVGVIALLAAGLALLGGKLGSGRGATVAAGVAISVLLVELAGLTRAQAATYRDAQTLWETTISRNPQAWIAHHNLGVGYFAAGETERGLRAYDRAIELKPDYADAYNNRGSAYFDRGDTEAAIAEYSSAIEFQPDHVLALTNRAAAYQLLGESELAIADFERVIHFAPESFEARLNLAIAVLYSEQFERAIELYTEVLRIAPDNATAYWHRCEAKRLLDRFDGALPDCDEAIRIDPKNGRAFLTRASVLLALGRNESAQQDFAAARDRGADSAAGFGPP